VGLADTAGTEFQGMARLPQPIAATSEQFRYGICSIPPAPLKICQVVLEPPGDQNRHSVWKESDSEK
jgi:hypothetical protein